MGGLNDKPQFEKRETTAEAAKIYNHPRKPNKVGSLGAWEKLKSNKNKFICFIYQKSGRNSITFFQESSTFHPTALQRLWHSRVRKRWPWPYRCLPWTHPIAISIFIKGKFCIKMKDHIVVSVPDALRPQYLPAAIKGYDCTLSLGNVLIRDVILLNVLID